MKPPVPWVGGKSSVADEILRRFPLKYSRFVEVFGGGGALTFHKTPDPDEVYNDLDGRLFNLFRCIRDRPMALLKELGFLPLCGRDEFFCLQRFLDKREFDDAFMQEELELASH